MKIIYLTNSSKQTRRLGYVLAKEILKTKLKRKKPFILGLTGELGGGKTTFLQGFARGLGIKERVLSPTFVIMRKFKIPIKKLPSPFFNFYHIDCYRLRKIKEILDIDFRKIISSTQSIVAIEWADKIRNILPRDTIWIKFKFVDKEKRKIEVQSSK
jgi:tRNA threonylcarbamoyladenosine biosynthesis protein TsaE